MEIKFCKNRINLIHPFGISRSSNDYYDIIYIYIFITKGLNVKL